MQGDNLIHLNPGGYNVYHEMDNINYNSFDVLIDNIIYRCREFMNGNQLKALQKNMIAIFREYELLQVHEDREHTNFTEDNMVMLDNFIKAKSLEGCSPRTIKYYQGMSVKFIEWTGKGFNEITPEDIRSYLKFKMEVDNVTNTTADNILRVLRTLFKWLNDEGYTLTDPTGVIPKIRAKKTVKEPFTPLELEKLRDSIMRINDKEKRLRDIALMELLLSSGVRVGELEKIDVRDVDWNNNSFVVFGKGAKEREVYFNVRTKKALQEYLEYREGGEALFCHINKNKLRLSINAMERAIREAGLKVGVKAHPHKFRRTFATSLLNKGVPIEQVRTLLGHENIETTTIYAIVDDEQVKVNHKRLME